MWVTKVSRLKHATWSAGHEMPDSISIDQVSSLALVMKFVRETSNSPCVVFVLHFGFNIPPCSRIWSNRSCGSSMMDLNTIEMRGRYDTNPAGVASLNDDDGVKSK